MSIHYVLQSSDPQTREEVRALPHRDLGWFMKRCVVVPTDFTNCLACYAYGVIQGETDEFLDATTAGAFERIADSDDLASLVPVVIKVSPDQFNAIMAILDRPAQSSPALMALLSTPTVFDRETP